MAQLEDFIYYLRKRLSPVSFEYYIVTAGVVSTTPTKTPIEYAPSGWQDKVVRYARDWEKSGIFTSYTVPMKFVMEGATIIRDVFFKVGVNAPLELFIEKLDRGTMTYGDFFLGDIDLTTLSDTSDYATVTVKSTEYLDQLATRSATNYEIAVDSSPDFFYIKMDGIDLVANFSWVTIAEPVSAPKPLGNGSNPEPTLMLYGYEGYNNGDIFGKDVTVNFSNVPFFFPPSYPTAPKEISLSHAQDWCLQNKSDSLAYDIDVEIDFDVTWGVDGGAPDGRIKVIAIVARSLVGLAASIDSETTLFTSSYLTAGNSATTNMTGTATLSVPPGYGIWFTLYYDSTGGGASGYATMVDAGDVTANFINHIPESYIKAIRPNEVFTELVDKMSGGDVVASSTILDTNESYAVTCGDALRGLEDAVLKTNFNDFFKSFDTKLLLGTDFDQSALTHYIRERSYYFDDSTVITDLGNVSNLEIKFLTEELFAGIEAGYDNYDYDEINGTDEFNTKFEWLSPNTKTTTKLNLLSPYRADMYGIEFTRANLAGKVTTDSSSDNDTFIIDIEAASAGTYLGVDYYNLYRDGALTINGLLSPDTAFNINLSPKRNLLNYGAFLRSMLYLSTTEDITFQIAAKNQLMDTDDGVTTIDEDEDITIGDLDAPLFYPVIFEFDFMPDLGISDIIKSNPYGCVTFNINGEQYKGFIIDLQENPATNESKKVKLLSTTTNTLTDLIT